MATFNLDALDGLNELPVPEQLAALRETLVRVRVEIARRRVPRREKQDLRVIAGVLCTAIMELLPAEERLALDSPAAAAAAALPPAPSQ